LLKELSTTAPESINVASNGSKSHKTQKPVVKMVQNVPNDHEIEPTTINGQTLESIKLDAIGEDDDTFTTTVYGSKYAALDLPRFEMPEGEMPREVAYRMIKDDLTLDGTPTLNLASFVTTYMEEEAEKLMIEGFSKNFIDYVRPAFQTLMFWDANIGK
jgi:hypothetical protein